MKRLRAVAPLLPLALLALLPLAEAWARVGGGQSYSGGSSGGGSYSGGSSGGGDGLGLLLWLVIQYPAIGIPVLIVVVIFFVWSKSHQPTQSYRSDRYQPVPRPTPRGPLVRRDQLVAADPNFSEPAFLDFAQLVYARVQQERTGERLDRVSAFLAPDAGAQLKMRSRGAEEVRDVIFGATRIESARVVGPTMELGIRFEVNLTEVREGKPQQWLLVERWRFQKAADTLSLPPEKLKALACPSCGNPAETRLDGSCVHCDTPVAGRSLWQVASTEVLSQTSVRPPELTLGGGDEPGTRLPTVFQPDFGARVRAFQARHPEFDVAAFKRRVVDVFAALQTAWDAGRWEDARPFETDHLYQTHRYWIERYKAFGLRNRLEQVQVLDVTPCKVAQDAFYEAITVRIRARMVDYTLDRDGKVVGGDRNVARTFTEYWTFLRSSGGSMSSGGTAKACPSCGAPLDRVNQAGVCGYCDAVITSGDFDWVLSSIEQDEAYHG